MAAKRTGLQDEVRELNETLDSISDLADEALDPGLSREEVIDKLKDIAEAASAEDEEGEEEQAGE
jgi:hypothetical protein